MNIGSDGKKIPELDGFRGFLVLWVTVGHVAASFDNWLGDLLGGHAIYLFLVTSGFLTFMMFDVRARSYREFIVSRAVRLFPAYLAALVVAVLLLPITLDAIQGNPYPLTNRSESRIEFTNAALDNLPAHFLAHATLLHGVLPPWALPHSTYTLIGPAWSLTLQWQFYLLAPILFALATQRSSAVKIAILLSSSIGAYLLHKANPGGVFADGVILGVAPLFAVGALSYYGWKSARMASSAVLRGLLPLTVAALAVVAPEWNFIFLVWALTLATTLRIENTFVNAAQGVLRSSAMQYVGKISYSMHLMHMSALFCVMYALNPYVTDPYLYAAAVTAGTILVSVGVSHLLYYAVEKPGMRLGDRLFSKGNAPLSLDPRQPQATVVHRPG